MNRQDNPIMRFINLEGNPERTPLIFTFLDAKNGKVTRFSNENSKPSESRRLAYLESRKLLPD